MSDRNGRLVVTYVYDLSDSDHTAMVARAAQQVRDTSRVGNVQVETDSTPSGVLPPGSVLYRMLEGFSSVGKNGQSIHSTVDDPAEFRLASGTAEPNVAFFGVSRRRATDGVEELIAMLLGKGWEAMRHLGARNYFGCWEWWIRDPSRATNDDQQFVRALSIEPDGIHLYMPVHAWTPGARVLTSADDPAMQALLKRVRASNVGA